MQEFSVHDGPGIRTTIFLKGCPLRCLWCANPEGQSQHPEPLHGRSRCRRCGTCIRACPQAAIVVGPDDYPRFRRELCASCVTRDCVRVCPAQAIRVMGEYWLPEDLYRRLAGPMRFYRNSGGGVTLSGGEPLAQPEFVRGLLDYCARASLAVGIETCGYWDWTRLESLVERLDFIYYDLKCVSADRHRQLTGHDNRLILENLRRVVRGRAKTIVTVPVVPGVNTVDEEPAAIADLCRELGIRAVRLLPYHALGSAKYEELGREYKLEHARPPSREELDNIRAEFTDRGVDCWIE
ncbi:MAG: glycyl-radical enzyme activating protein [candidate division WOR-3 bacterium]|nr:glycyl-radical enzyme activating protein [candidate division WOR-3 bacterium]